MFCKSRKAQRPQLPPVITPLPMAPTLTYVWSGSFMVGRISARTESESSSSPPFRSYFWGAPMHLHLLLG